MGAVLRRKRPLDDVIDESAEIGHLAPRDRAFARLLVATVLRRLGHDAPLLDQHHDAPKHNPPAWLREAS
ncbi:MAG: MFS transporter, partial [Acidobacteriota bacterium]